MLVEQMAGLKVDTMAETMAVMMVATTVGVKVDWRAVLMVDS